MRGDSQASNAKLPTHECSNKVWFFTLLFCQPQKIINSICPENIFIIYKFIKDIYLKISSKTWNYLKRKKEGSIKEDKGKKKGRWLIQIISIFFKKYIISSLW